MTWAEFEEKEYESAAFGELMRSDASGKSFAFSAGQVLEGIVGYDAAATPSAAHVVWRILQLPRPAGVRLLPSLWPVSSRPPAERLPGTPVTLVVQFKRPEYLYGATAAQWKYWKEPYFRFTREAQQQKVLRALESSTGADALVRYAAPAFWRLGELEAAHVRGEVVQSSGFVSPERLARHRCWTYLKPGIDGRANPGGSTSRFETHDELFNDAFRREAGSAELVPREALGEHVDRIGAGAAEAAPASLRRDVMRWRAILREREPDLGSATVARVGGIAMLSSVAALTGSTWLVLAGS